MKGWQLEWGRDVFREERFANGGVPALGVCLLPRAVLPWPPAVCSTRPFQAEPVSSVLVLDSTAA